MSRVYRALEKAEKEKLERQKQETPVRDPSVAFMKEEAPSRREEPTPKLAEERREEYRVPAERGTSILIPSMDSFAAEQFRKLRTQILYQSPGSPHSVLVTSTTPGEGKTIVSVNLAVAISQEFHKRAVLIDADLRRPSIHFATPTAAKGLSDYLLGHASFSDILLKYHEESLWVIPAGETARKSSELIGSRRMPELLQSLRDLGEETYVVVDSPPILSTSEPTLLSKMVDAVILVVMADRTPKQSVKRALESIEKQKLMGVVFNEKESKPLPGYHYGYYNRYYGK